MCYDFFGVQKIQLAYFTATQKIMQRPSLYVLPCAALVESQLMYLLNRYTITHEHCPVCCMMVHNAGSSTQHGVSGSMLFLTHCQMPRSGAKGRGGTIFVFLCNVIFFVILFFLSLLFFLSFFSIVIKNDSGWCRYLTLYLLGFTWVR